MTRTARAQAARARGADIRAQYACPGHNHPGATVAPTLPHDPHYPALGIVVAAPGLALEQMRAGMLRHGLRRSG